MRYLVILDPLSTSSKCYAGKGVDGTWYGQACLACVELDASHPNYLLAVRAFDYGGKALRQRLHLPHDAVAFVVECEDEVSTQVGFRKLTY